MLSTKGGAHRLFLYIQIVKLLDNSSISIDKVEVVAYTKYILFYDHLSLYTTLIFHTKIEGRKEVYSDIVPVFKPKKRLKIGTFKVESTGFRLGERFIKIIFDNALQYNVDEIYVTLFKNRKELDLLRNLLFSWGFFIHGTKRTGDCEELVMVKEMKSYDMQKSIKENFPLLNLSTSKFIHPIYPEYHTDLFPDSILKTENEENYLDNKAHRYSLEKIYIQWMPLNGARPGDLVLFYRTGDNGTNKKYTSTITLSLIHI